MQQLRASQHRPNVRQQQRSAGSYAQRSQLPSRRAVSCHASVVWRQLERTKTWLAHPRSARTKGVVHFLGGAFAGAAPQLLYNSFVELLADAGYTVIATPYKVTFRHDACARQVRQAFLDSLAELKATGRSYLVPPKAPQFGVGHSNGALLHLLINSYEPGATDANVIISYNNLQVSDAIPIPGFLDSLQPTVQAARAANTSSTTNTTTSSSASSSMPSQEEGSSSSSEGQLLAVAAATLPLAEQQQLLLAGAAPALEQLSSVVNEVGDGLTDFTPSPQESRAIITAGYACPATLLVQFKEDNFDETPEMQRLLSDRLAGSSDSNAAAAGSSGSSAAAGTRSVTSSLPASGYTSAWNSIDEDVSMDILLTQLQELQASLQEQEQLRQQKRPGASELQQLLLPGSHVTPCGAQLQGSFGPSPFDVVLNNTSNSRSQADLQILADKVLAFLDNKRAQAAERRAGMLLPLPQQQPAASASDAGDASATEGASPSDAEGVAGEAAAAAAEAVVTGTSS